jgi:hypothetical protein
MMSENYLLMGDGAAPFRTFQRMRRHGHRAMAMVYLELAVQDGYPPALYIQKQIKTRI